VSANTLSASLFVSAISQWAMAVQRGDPEDIAYFVREVNTLGKLLLTDPDFVTRLRDRLNDRCTPAEVLKGMTDFLASLSTSNTLFLDFNTISSQ
jgi:hypothetical protein